MSVWFFKLCEIVENPEDAVARDTTQPTAKTFGKHANFDHRALALSELARDIDSYLFESPELSIIDRNRRFRQILSQAAKVLRIGPKDIEYAYEVFEDPAQKYSIIPALKLEVLMPHQMTILKDIKKEAAESQRILDGLGRRNKTILSQSFSEEYEEDYMIDNPSPTAATYRKLGL